MKSIITNVRKGPCYNACYFCDGPVQRYSVEFEVAINPPLDFTNSGLRAIPDPIFGSYCVGRSSVVVKNNTDRFAVRQRWPDGTYNVFPTTNIYQHIEISWQCDAPWFTLSLVVYAHRLACRGNMPFSFTPRHDPLESSTCFLGVLSDPGDRCSELTPIRLHRDALACVGGSIRLPELSGAVLAQTYGNVFLPFDGVVNSGIVTYVDTSRIVLTPTSFPELGGASDCFCSPVVMGEPALNTNCGVENGPVFWACLGGVCTEVQGEISGVPTEEMGQFTTLAQCEAVCGCGGYSSGASYSGFADTPILEPVDGPIA